MKPVSKTKEKSKSISITTSSTKSNLGREIDSEYMETAEEMSNHHQRHTKNGYCNFILEEMKRIPKCPNPINSSDPTTNKQVVKATKICTVDSNHLKHVDIWNEFKTFFLKNFEIMKDEREKLWNNIHNFIQAKDIIENDAECKFIQDFLYIISCTTNKQETNECMSRLRSIISTLKDVDVFMNLNISIPKFNMY